jgi:hypothetical protein
MHSTLCSPTCRSGASALSDVPSFARVRSRPPTVACGHDRPMRPAVIFRRDAPGVRHSNNCAQDTQWQESPCTVPPYKTMRRMSLATWRWRRSYSRSGEQSGANMATKEQLLVISTTLPVLFSSSCMDGRVSLMPYSSECPSPIPPSPSVATKHASMLPVRFPPIKAVS